ncbi:phospholipid carrier-dependent glycosyltransferase [Methanoplanus sp. FWC-SCC4]|uniref:Phospholipid carrier-dependent glycosyltransferase n=1 Tax=Methanochimaera problematica TaxID=2609417 RepID=A0AA97FDL9_9EURY|nr:glycosyltransferase family 39 protein [Methanoplanus sp. FWC-SCC4]WOF17122.1 phospholipid carrier-dependent glycosyltransferase [Methanoplanus sp. FWC-SCC4]
MVKKSRTNQKVKNFSKGYNSENFTEENYSVKSTADLNFNNLKNVLMTNKYAWMLIFLTFAGFVLRFYNLGFNSIWLDEGSTINFAQRSLSGIWEATIGGGEFNPPLFYYLEHFMLTFGESEVTLRFLPALFGALCIPIMYFIGREAVDEKSGIIAAALMTFSSFQIFYSQDARAYTTVLFFFSVALICYLWALKNNNIKWWILFGLFSAISFWTHFYIVIAVGIIFLHAIYTNRNEIRENISNIKPVLAAFAIFTIITIPIIIATITLFFKRAAGGETWGLKGIDVITTTFVQISGGNVMITLIFGLLALAGGYKIFTMKRDLAVLIGLSLILPFIASFILSAAIPMSPRYLIYLLPFYFMAIAGSVKYLPESYNSEKIAALAIVIILLLNLPALMPYYTTYSKNDWRGFSTALESVTNEGDKVVLLPGYMHQPFDYYYDNETDRTEVYQYYTKEELNVLSEENPNSTIYYVVTGDIMSADPTGGSLQWLEQNAVSSGQHTGIYVFKSK